MYNLGPHAGNFAFEIGDPDLPAEVAYGADLSLRYRSARVVGAGTVFLNRFDRFIFPFQTGEVDDEGFTVVRFTSADSQFRGFEGHVDVGLTRNVWLIVGADAVRGELRADDSPSPRIPPRRLWAGLRFERGRFHVEGEVRNVGRQKRVCGAETPTDGYTVVNVHGTLRLPPRTISTPPRRPTPGLDRPRSACLILKHPRRQIVTKTQSWMLALLVAATAPVLAAERPDFTGLWVPDAARSSTRKELKGDPAAPPAPPPPPAAQLPPRLRIEHRDPALHLTFLGPDGSPVSTYALRTDGLEAVNHRGEGLLHRSTTAWRGTALVTTWRLESHGTRVIGGTETRELEDAGGTLVVTAEIEDARSRTRTVAVYSLSTREAPTQTAASPSAAAHELQRLFEEDQSDSRPYATREERAETDVRARGRIERAAALVRRGLLQSADDYYHAAMVFQHGTTSEDALTAHVLASVAGFKGHPWGRWLSAASLDLFLLSIGRDQVLGTIYGERDFARYDRRLSDAVRREYCVPPVEVQLLNQEVLARGRRDRFQRRAVECGE